jgi:hypothetical protein
MRGWANDASQAPVKHRCRDAKGSGHDCAKLRCTGRCSGTCCQSRDLPPQCAQPSARRDGSPFIGVGGWRIKAEGPCRAQRRTPSLRDASKSRKARGAFFIFVRASLTKGLACYMAHENANAGAGDSGARKKTLSEQDKPSDNSQITSAAQAIPPGESWAEMWQHPFDWAKFDGGAP